MFKPVVGSGHMRAYSYARGLIAAGAGRARAWIREMWAARGRPQDLTAGTGRARAQTCGRGAGTGTLLVPAQVSSMRLLYDGKYEGVKIV
jgi:hypothetical protein